MKVRVLLLTLLVGAAVFFASCQKSNSTLPPQTKPSLKLPISYRQLLEWDVPPGPHGQGNGLQGLAVDNTRNVYVADAEGRRVLAYDSDGKLLRIIQPDARHPNILRRPYGLLFDGHDRLYVTDYDADQVQVFTTTGKFLFAWGHGGKSKGEFRAPVAIDQDGEGNIYSVEFYGMRVQKFSHDGRFILTWGSEAPWGKPAPPEEFLYPDGLAVRPDGNVYVTDAGHDRIKTFRSDGKFLREWGVKGLKPGDLNAAGGIAIDSKGRLYEADAAMHRVQMFTIRGELLGYWILPDAANLKVWCPTNLRPASPDLLYVSDFAPNRIYKLAVTSSKGLGG